MNTYQTLEIHPPKTDKLAHVNITVPMVIAAIFGVLIGAISVWAFGYSERQLRGRAEPTVKPEDSPDSTTALLDSLRSAVIVLDSDLSVLRATAAAYAFGLVRDDRIAHERVLALVRSVKRDDETIEEELTLPLGPIGTGEITLSIRVAPLWADNFLVMADDRSDAVRVERIRHEFVTNISHELKTPVGALSLLAETIHDAADDPEAVRRFAGRMEKETYRLTMLVQDIIELSHLQTAAALTNLAPVDIDQVIHEAIDQAATGADGKNIRITIDATTPYQVFGDKSLLANALRNLLDNAVHYSAEGTEVTVRTREEGGLVEISVSDEGIGIDPEYHERIFERFYRVDKARSRETGGTGLGLSIVKHIAANHGGEVTVSSRVGEGSTFTLRIPLARRTPAL